MSQSVSLLPLATSDSGMSQHLSYPLDLPVPQDDGACSHLVGLPFPADILVSVTHPQTPGISRNSEGEKVSIHGLSQLGTVIVFFYPRSGSPDEIVPEEWNAIPGARGCTPQNCSYRDAYHSLLSAGLKPGHLFGCSTQSMDVHAELINRLHLPYSILSDAELQLANTLNLPTFEYQEKKLIRRLTIAVQTGKIVKVWYPVFPPDKGVEDVIAWLKSSSA